MLIGEKGSFLYTGYAPLKHLPVQVHYFIPAGESPESMPVLFTFHGAERNGEGALNAWIQTANDKKVMVFAPEFSTDLYPDILYQRGGIYSSTTIRPQYLQPEHLWTFSLIEPLFGYVKEQTGSRAELYDMFGFSGGAQFVHRFITFKPESNIRKVVAASAGWYTVPDFDVTFPYGLKETPMDIYGEKDYYEKLFSLDVTILCGTNDNDPNANNLNKSTGAMLQGATRVERKNYYWAEVVRLGADYNFCWQHADIGGVAHEQSKMAKVAATILY